MKNRTILLTGLAAGIIIGILALGILLFTTAPSMMLKTYEAVYGYDETIERIQERIESAGWMVSAISELNNSLSREGAHFEPRVTLLSLCHPKYAESVLTTDRYVSVMMPCKFSIWEGDDGKVYLTKMNMRLMGKMFGGNISEIMGGKVARDEESMLKGLLKE
jgi:uncharacterized protein (DUF302 family)